MWVEKTKTKPQIFPFHLLKQISLLWHTFTYKCLNHCKHLSAFILSMQSAFPLLPKQLPWAFVQLSVNTVHISLSYSGLETASFLLVILQSGWKGRSSNCLGNIKKQFEWKRVQNTSILYWPQDRKRDFPLDRPALLHFYVMQCLQKPVPKTLWLFHSQIYYDAGIDTKIKNLPHKHVLWLCIWNILGLL